LIVKSRTSQYLEEQTVKIGIIGAGNIGSVLARKFVEIGHSVQIANSRGPDTLSRVSEQTGAAAVELIKVADGAALIIIAIPQKNIPHLPKALFGGMPADSIIVDTGNYYPTIRDGQIDGIKRGLTESQWVSLEIGRPVVKAFNSITAQSLATKGRPIGAADRIALPVAGNSAAFKERVMELAASIGFDALDGGTLEDSWRQQPGAPAYCTDLPETLLREALAQADRDQLPSDRELQVQMMLAASAPRT
jgi:predicted dinucleotide-binding enzyme